MDRDTDGACLICDGAGDRLTNPPGGVGGELEAAAVLELVDCLHQADVTLLNQVEELQATVGVFLGDGDYQTQVGLDHLFLGAACLAFANRHHTVDLFQAVDADAALLFEVEQLLLRAQDVTGVALQCCRVLLFGGDLFVDPLQVGLIFREGGDEVLAWHASTLNGQVHDHALILTYLLHCATDIGYQAIQQFGYQLALHELVGDLAA